MTLTDESAVQPLDAARSLVGGAVSGIASVQGGRNSRVYRIESEGRVFALKQYPSMKDDPRNRLATEVAALTLMARHRIDCVPRVIGVDAAHGYVLLTWLDGGPVTLVGAAEVDAAAEFLAALHGLRGTDLIAHDILASEACLSGNEIVRQIDARLALLQSAAGEERVLQNFLDGPFRETSNVLVRQGRRRMQASNLDFAALLPPEKRSLIPADFGFHNSLRRPDRALAFFDFEYFGWDDPVKLTADLLFHPATPAAPQTLALLRTRCERIYGDDPDFGARLVAFASLFGLRWVLIVLNEFLPERWRGRLAAGAQGSWEEAKSRQLALARALLDRVQQDVEGDIMHAP